jgi:hypothetical protein
VRQAPVHLNQLASALMKRGRATFPCYNGPTPVLHVYAEAVPKLRERISVMPDSMRREYWFRSSTGSLLAPCAHPAEAAAK